MSEKISEYPLTAASIVAGSYLDISEETAPLVFVSKKLPAALILALGDNIYNADGTLDGDRLLQGDNNGFGLGMTKLKYFQLDALEVSISSSGVDKNVTVITPNTGALIIPSSSDPDTQITSPVEFMIKGDSTDNDVRVYVGGAWVSLLSAGGIYGGDGAIGAGTTSVAVPATSELDFGSGMLVVTGLNLPAVGQGGNVGIKVAGNSPLSPLHIGAGFNATGQASLLTPLTGHTALFQNNFNVADPSRLAIVSGINGFGSLDFGDASDIDVGRVFYRHNTNAMSFYTNATEQFIIDSSGVVQVNDLSGAGTRMIVADASGKLSSQAVPSGGDGIYDGSGALSGSTVVTMGGNSLQFNGGFTAFGGATDVNYILKTYGSVNLDNGLATFDKIPVTNRNISVTTQGLTTNGTGLYVSNAQTLVGDITTGHFIASGSTTTNTALSLRAINGGTNNALSVIAGDISVRQDTTKVLFGVTGFLANARFSLINEGSFTTGFDVYSATEGDNTGYSARGSSASSSGGNQYGFKANNGTGAANNTYGFHGTISAGGATNTANVYGYYLDWNGAGASKTASGLQKGLYFDMRTNANTNETISGDLFGADILLGAGSSSDSIGNSTGLKLKWSDTAGSTTAKAVGLEIDLTGSDAAIQYGVVVSGDVKSGFGISAPTEAVDILGSVQASVGYKVNGSTGFTGAGAYTNFTIEGGIITAAS